MKLYVVLLNKDSLCHMGGIFDSGPFMTTSDLEKAKRRVAQLKIWFPNETYTIHSIELSEEVN